MGWGTYSSDARHVRASTRGFYTKSKEEIFDNRSLNEAMNPRGVTLRESRDNDDHPNSFATIIVLDVTGSMLHVPEYLVRTGLPKVVSTIIQRGFPDPQILFIAVGDHETDKAPLQIGQFESNDEKLDYWLTNVYLEAGGGSNSGESYILSWFFAGYYTQHDAWDKRGMKGLLITIGDEPPLLKLPDESQAKIMGNGQYGDLTAEQLLTKVQERYHVYHIHTTETGTGKRAGIVDVWKKLLGQNVIVVDDSDTIVKTIVELTMKHAISGDTDATPEPAPDGTPDPTPIFL